MRTTVLAPLALGLWMAGAAAAQSTNALEGAWRVDALIGPGDRLVEDPQPGLLLFAGRYYSYTFVTSAEPRPPLPRGPATPELLVNAWNPFTANAGTYETRGEVMTRRPIVAKGPDAMAPGVFNEYTYRMSADTLWITPVRTEAGEIRMPTTARYVRVR
jgi:hypothetical protein